MIYTYQQCYREIMWEINRRDPVTRSFFIEQTVYNLKQKLIEYDSFEQVLYARAGLDALRSYEKKGRQSNE